jgi:hypothetical protein
VGSKLLKKLFLGLALSGLVGCTTLSVPSDEPGRINYSSFNGKYGKYSTSIYLNGTITIEKRSNGIVKRFTFQNQKAYDDINQAVFNATGMHLIELKPNPEWFFGSCDLADVNPRDGVITTEETDYALKNWIFERAKK